MSFDTEEYANKMIEMGCDPESARIIANKKAEAYQSNANNESAADPDPAVTNPLALVEPGENEEKEVKPLTKSQLKLVDAGLEIRQEKPSGNDLTFVHSVMCQIGLPRSKVDGLDFERTCGGAGIYIQAGKLWDGKKFVQQPVPYGPMPRLVMAYLNTQALRTKSQEIEVGQSASEFLRRLGKESNGGKNGSYTMFRKQIMALAACNLSIGITTATSAITYDGKPIKQFEAWLSESPDHGQIWPGIITFSNEYFSTLNSHAVPIDLRALNALASSALAMDIYTMLSDRLHRIGSKPVRLFWSNLREQFGQEYQGPDADKNFKKKFLPALKQVLEVYPSAIVKPIRGGVMMMSSPPPVAYKTKVG